jgi:hypothetical protein
MEMFEHPTVSSLARHLSSKREIEIKATPEPTPDDADARRRRRMKRQKASTNSLE